MRRLAVVALAGVLGLTLASAAASTSGTLPGIVKIGIGGWGNVRFGIGFADRGTKVTCTRAACNGFADASHYRSSLTATAATGWKFVGWLGVCKGQKRTCKVDLHRVHRNAALGLRLAHTIAMFKPVAPGFTQAYPIPLGQTGPYRSHLPGGFSLTINSTTPNAQLSQPAPPGAEYFVANVTATYTGAGSTTTTDLYYNLIVVGSHNFPYNDRDQSCPYGEPAPVFPVEQLYSGQVVSGNVCWTIATNDASSLEMNTGHDYPIWFALRP
jgi:hypothetical protein